MLREQLAVRGINDPRVLEAMGRVKRHLFVDEALRARAYEDLALPIGHGQTISQPLTVARMTMNLDVQPGMKVLEIGTGSGYQAAVLSELGAEVYSVERLSPLFHAALKRLNTLRYFTVRLKLDDGTMGWPAEAPFDRILVTAGGPRVPLPLLEQLADPGQMVLPVGDEKRSQRLVRIRRQDGKAFKQDLGQAVFVDLVGEHGWT